MTHDLRPIEQADRAWAATLLCERWGSARSVSRGRVLEADAQPAFVARSDDVRVGLVTYHVEADACEIVTLDSLREREGIGTALVDAVRTAAAEAGCRRLWLVTTNDNLDAQRFWQRRGFTVVAVHHGAMEESRRLKPEIPRVGRHGIEIRDEIELEQIL